MSNRSDFSVLLEKSATGDRSATNDLFGLVYQELKQLASLEMGREAPGHTLQSTALVHEVWVKLVGGSTHVRWNDRAHFFSTTVSAMRRILVDSARKRHSQKRGGENKKFELRDDDRIHVQDDELIALDEALDQLAENEPDIAKLVSLRFFGGLTIAQAAEHLGVSATTADRHWAFGRAWLREKLGDES